MSENNTQNNAPLEQFRSDMAHENNTNAVAHSETKLIAMVDPNAVMQFGHKLKWYITKNKLSVNIQGKEYAMVDGWKFAGMNFGIVPMCEKPVRMHSHKEALYVHKKNQKDRYGKQVQSICLLTTDKELHLENKADADAIYVRSYFAYECTCKLISITTGKEIGFGHAVCTNSETKKADFDEYAIASMAQTRAIGKAFRNLLGYVMNAVGYEATPAEEMEEETYHRENNKQKQPSKATQESLQQIFDLLDNESLNPEVVSKIEESMMSFTEERAQRCIQFLKEEISKKGGNDGC
jgi:hypothetical protein